MKGAILSIGDELCIGQVVNGNAAYIAKKCTAIGLPIDIHITVGDRQDHIVAYLRHLQQDHDILFLTGGLGPTHDDRTKAAIAEFLNVPIQKSPEVEQWVREYLERQGREYTPVQEEQSLIPAHCEPLYNKYGTAPGLWCQLPNFPLLIALPGVPYEMEYIMETAVLPRLQHLLADEPKIYLRTYGVLHHPEAELYAKLRSFIERLEREQVTTAFLPSPKLVRLRFQFTSKDPAKLQRITQKIEEELRRVVGLHFLPLDVPLEQVVGQRLTNRQETLAVAESCTGGFLGKRITDIPGSSAYFLGGMIVYSNEAKVKFLHVPEEILQQHGAVSRQVAEILAEQVRKAFNTTYGIGITGIAGPSGGSPEKPVGTVWIGISCDRHCSTAQKFIFPGSRDAIRRASVNQALIMLLTAIAQREQQHL